MTVAMSPATKAAAAKERLERKLSEAERTLADLSALIKRGRLGWSTAYRLNRVCGKIEKIDKTLHPEELRESEKRKYYHAGWLGALPGASASDIEKGYLALKEQEAQAGE